jgi:molecular chaperone HscB
MGSAGLGRFERRLFPLFISSMTTNSSTSASIVPPALPLRLDSSDFELFDLPARFDLDPAVISQRWKALQAAAHPDRFAAEGGAAQRVAMQWSVRVNEAYQRLKDPQKRAAYLCALHGAAVDAESNTAMPATFLAEQMQWREALDEAADAPAVQALADQVAAARRRLLEALADLIDRRQDWRGAAAQVRALMFVTRFGEDVHRRLEDMQG